MELRSMFKWIFGRGKAQQASEGVRLLNGYSNAYMPFSGNAYDDAAVRDCIDTIARNFGKMRPRRIRRQNDGVLSSDDSLDYLLSNKPNPLMTASEFLEKVAA